MNDVFSCDRLTVFFNSVITAAQIGDNEAFVFHMHEVLPDRYSRVCVHKEVITQAFESCLSLGSTLTSLISRSLVRGKVNTALKDSSPIL